MTYTISTEPVTQEHIGRKVLVWNSWIAELEEGILNNILVNDKGKRFFNVQFEDGPFYPAYGYENALLIVEG